MGTRRRRLGPLMAVLPRLSDTIPGEVVMCRRRFAASSVRACLRFVATGAAGKAEPIGTTSTPTFTGAGPSPAGTTDLGTAHLDHRSRRRELFKNRIFAALTYSGFLGTTSFDRREMDCRVAVRSVRHCAVSCLLANGFVVRTLVAWLERQGDGIVPHRHARLLARPGSGPRLARRKEVRQNRSEFASNRGPTPMKQGVAE